MAAEIIAEIDIQCEDGRVRTLYVKFESEGELDKHNDSMFDDLYEQFQTALNARYPNEQCDIDDTPEITRTFKLVEGGKTMKSSYRTSGTLELPAEINLEVK